MEFGQHTDRIFDLLSMELEAFELVTEVVPPVQFAQARNVRPKIASLMLNISPIVCQNIYYIYL